MLVVNVILQSDSPNKVKRQTKRDGQIEKRTGTMRHKINTFTDSLRGTKLLPKKVIDKSRRQKYIWKPLWLPPNIHMKMCILDIPQKNESEI